MILTAWSLVFAYLIASFGVCALSPSVLIGVKEETQKCSAPMECKNPLYCIPKEGTDNDFSCERMPCGPLFACTIGQQCGTSGFCEPLPCTSDTACTGITVCIESKCQLKKNSGEQCERAEECWSDLCIKGLCITQEDPNKPFTRNRAADIALAVIITLSIATALAICIICMRTRKFFRPKSPNPLEETVVNLPKNEMNGVPSNPTVQEPPTPVASTGLSAPANKAKDKVTKLATTAKDTALDAANTASSTANSTASAVKNSAVNAANSTTAAVKDSASSASNAASSAADKVQNLLGLKSENPPAAK